MASDLKAGNREASRDPTMAEIDSAMSTRETMRSINYQISELKDRLEEEQRACLHTVWFWVPRPFDSIRRCVGCGKVI